MVIPIGAGDLEQGLSEDSGEKAGTSPFFWLVSARVEDGLEGMEVMDV